MRIDACPKMDEHGPDEGLFEGTSVIVSQTLIIFIIDRLVNYPGSSLRRNHDTRS
jgi:hypothetical protein